MIRSSLRLSLSRQRGVSIITAIFLLLLLAGLAALMANVISTAHTTSAEDVLGARAYQAARAGVEWGLYKVLEGPDAGNWTNVVPNGACNPPGNIRLSRCPAPFPVANLDGYEVNVSCEPFPSADGYYQEGCRIIRLYRLTATATGPGPSGLRIEREVQVTAEQCRDATTGRDC